VAEPGDIAPATDDNGEASLVARILEAREQRERAEAEAELYKRYHRRIYLFGLRHVHNAAAAEDLVQDVLATVIQRVREGAVREPEKIGAFVVGTCRMLATNRARGDARKARLLAKYGDPRTALTSHPHDADDPQNIERVDLVRVGDCLSKLPDRERTVLLLTFYGELDAPTIGRELGLQASHVRVMRHRAIGHLQDCVRGGRREEDA
jgi:RNA polymerase sigma-70 factor, ECF subfamily